MEPRTIQNFRLVEKLGEGGMGEVFLGLDTMLERKVAVKALRPELMARQDIVERFRSEAIALAKLNHSNIATLYSYLNFENQFFMIMEYVQGETLDLHLRRNGAMHWAEATRLVCQVLKGLEHAHQMGIVHRDIKPANIIITDDGVPKLMDFGIARILETARLTRVGHLVGTLEYISPEQVAGKETDSRSDLYSLGAVFYEMLTSRLPFKKNTDYELIKAQIEEKPEALRRINPDIPSGLEKAVLKMLHKKPGKRFSDAAACCDALERVLSKLPADAAVKTMPSAKKVAMPSFLKTWWGNLKIWWGKYLGPQWEKYLKPWWEKYPGVVILMVAGSIAVIIFGLVALNHISTGRTPRTGQIASPVQLPQDNRQQPIEPPAQAGKKNLPQPVPVPIVKKSPPRQPAPEEIKKVVVKPPAETRKKEPVPPPPPENSKGWGIRK